jgi:uncharacterized integral membrane protein
MPWRLVQLIITFAIILVFIVFNLSNKSDINFGFTEFKDVPVFLTVFCSILFGMLCSFPYIFTSKLRKKGKTADSKQKPANSPDTPNNNNYGID